MSVIDSSQLLATGDDGYQISRSVRLRSSASAYFNRTPSVAGNLKTWTWSGWVKRGSLGSVQDIFSCGTNGVTYHDMYFNSDDTLRVVANITGTPLKYTTQVFRDPSAWYHIVNVFDTTNATAEDRWRLYVNGVRITVFGTSTNPTLNDNGLINSTSYPHAIGQRVFSGSNYLDGYLTEINFIDGQALTPSSFGQNDPVTGVWGPKKYAGTYGTNGFYLNFSDNSAATAAAIGKDSSGNGNNWTPNNISVTAGVTYDSMIDTPTPYADGGNGRGNYCVLNPLLASASLSAGNLDFSQTNTKTAATFGVTSGKWYAEAKVNTVANQLFILGVAKVGDGSSYNMFASGVGYYANDGTKYVDGTNTSYGATYTAGDTIGIALDMDGGTVTFYKNNTSQGSITLPASSQGYFPLAIQASSGSTSATWSVNFGQRPFTYTPPTGFVALNTQNLPAPTIKAGNKYFDATTYTGNGTSQSIVNSGAFQPDLVWYKSRSAVTDHRLFDSVRGIANALYSDTTSAETAEATAITSLNSNGFSLGAGSGNTNTQTYVGWQWKKGATPGFDIVTYTGTGSTRTVAHSLGVAPSMIIIKNRSVGTDDWPVYHVSVGAASRLYLDTTGASTSDPTGFMNSTAPTSSVFTVGSNSSVNNSGSNLVAYCFAEVAGFSKFGKYTGNGSTDGPFVYCGFRPRFVMIKETTANGTGAWVILDSSRDTYNQTTNALFANSSAAESTTFYTDFLSNGFKLRVGSGSVMNFNSSSTYIYAAFAENPFRLALAR